MKPYILFLCWHNSGRSQLAQAYFNAHNRNGNIEARSAGTSIKWNGLINPKIAKLLLQNGIDIAKQREIYYPKMYTQEMLMEAQKIFTMGCMENCQWLWVKIDDDFWLADPEDSNTNIEEMFQDFLQKIKPIIWLYNH